MMSLDCLSPQVQRVQATWPYIDIYTNVLVSPPGHRESEKNADFPVSLAYPEPKKWETWGARHINDKAPFDLWDEQNRKFRSPVRNELQWICDEFGNKKLHMSGWYMCIETNNPPHLVPLTVGSMPVMFVSIGEEAPEPISTLFYSNPRISDPCPAVQLSRMTLPTKEQNNALLAALEPLANVRTITYMPHWTIVELHYGDGRTYEPRSLPGTVARRTALYHHSDAPFHESVENTTWWRKGMAVCLSFGESVEVGTVMDNATL